MRKLIWYAHSAVKKKMTDVYHKINKSHNNYDEWKKLGKKNTLWFHFYKNLEMQK